ncbi:hypothetical protein F5Y06DRAFT_66670 [Hypoxylon sp. FL0890]|nr:hypothetical protein F5Y06DRAFT_66670 [Hypoxylon sp. FL0890]
MGLSRVTIIAAPTKEPREVIQPGSSIYTVFAPTLLTIIQCQQLFGAASLSLRSQVHWLTWQCLRLSRIIASQVYFGSSFFRGHVVILVRKMWETRIIRRLRKKIVVEFFALMLGSGGNCVCLVLFWPGWWLLGLVGLAARFWIG